MRTVVTSVLMICALCGCDPFAEPDSLLETYTDRLAYVLDVELKPAASITVQTFPRLRDRRVDIDELEISMLSFLSLYGCELQVVVAERNSILGRVMTPLNELRYQLRFIDKANQCLPVLDNESLINKLRQAMQHKRDNLAAYFWNAVWADEPMAAMLTRSKGLYPITTNKQKVSELSRQLDALILLSKQLDTIKDEAVFDGLGEIQQSWLFNPVPGQLLNSASLLITELNQGSEMMQQRLQGRPLCYQHKPNTQSERLKGLFFSVYIGRVQPYLAKTAQAGQQVFSRLQQLAASQKAVMPDTFETYYQYALALETEGSVWQQLDKAIQLHTERWQQLFLQCGIQPVAG